MIDFSGKKAIVTGGTRGIGNCIVKSLVKSGCKVLFTGTKERNMKIPSSSDYHKLDFNNKESVNEFSSFLESNFDKVDILVNNAGINIVSDIRDFKIEDFQSVLNVNLIGPALLTSIVSKKMANNNYGRIVNISSIFGINSRSGRSNYSASKAGLIGHTKAVALDLASSGILVNSVCPGFVNTELTKRILGEKEMNNLVDNIPIERLAIPEDIASVVMFLASDLNTYTTGQTIVVDGGYVIE